MPRGFTRRGRSRLCGDLRGVERFLDPGVLTSDEFLEGGAALDIRGVDVVAEVGRLLRRQHQKDRVPRLVDLRDDQVALPGGLTDGDDPRAVPADDVV